MGLGPVDTRLVLPCQDPEGNKFESYHEYLDHAKKNSVDKIHFKNGRGQESFAPTFNDISEIYPVHDLGFKMHNWFPVDLERAREWWHEFHKQNADTEFFYQGKPNEPNSWGCVYGDGASIYHLKDEQLTGYLLEIHNALIDLGLDKEAFEWVVVNHTPGTRLGMHVDEQQWLTVHIPLYTNDKCDWTIGGEQFFMPLGNCYIINSTEPHDVVNYGDTDRIHIYFSINASQIDKVKLKPKI